MATGRVPTTANSPLTAKGDLFGYSTTQARVAVGNDGETLVADSSTSTGLRYQPTNAAGKNCIINGGMDIWQRGTTITATAYTADRWYVLSGAAATVTRTTAKTTPNSQYMMLMTATTTQQIFAYQAIETLNAVYYAGKTVTLSAYAAGLTTTTNLNMILQYSTSTDNSVTGTWTDITSTGGSPNLTLSSTVTRWSVTYDVPSTAKSLRVQIVNNAANITVGQGIYLGDVQLEVGSVATAFSRAGGTIQGELAACQYYFRPLVTGSNAPIGGGAYAQGSTRVDGSVNFSQMRVAPTLTASSGTNYYSFGGASNTTFSTINGGFITNNALYWYSSTTGTITAGHGGFMYGSNASSSITLSAEL